MLWISKCYRYLLNSDSHVCFLIDRFRWIGHIHTVVTRITSMNWLLLSLSLSVVVIYLCCCCWPVLTCPHTAQYLPSIYTVSTRYLHGRYIYSAPAPAQQLTAPTPGRAHTLTIVTLLPIVHSALLEVSNNNVLQCNVWLRTTPYTS